jgi:hypothetical protein
MTAAKPTPPRPQTRGAGTNEGRSPNPAKPNTDNQLSPPDPASVAEYIALMADELSDIASAAGLFVVTYFLNMARIEADALSRAETRAAGTSEGRPPSPAKSNTDNLLLPPDPASVAEYIALMAAELLDIASAARLAVVTYFLNMARIDADALSVPLNQEPERARKLASEEIKGVTPLKRPVSVTKDKIASPAETPNSSPANPARRIVDVGIAELSDLANDAWNSAAQDALTQGHTVTGSCNGRRIRQYPDGHQDDLGPVTPLPDNAKPSRQ